MFAKRRLIVAAFLFLWFLAAFGESAIASQGSCVLPTTGTVSGLTAIQDMNACIDAIQTQNSGATAPLNTTGSPSTYQLWMKSTNGTLSMYDAANWLAIGVLDATNHVWTPPVGGGTLPTLSSSTTTDLGSVPQSTKYISGTTTITSFGNSAVVGTRHVIVFTGVLSLTYNGTSMILPGGLSITTAVGDLAEALYLGASNWRVISYTRVDGSAVTNPAMPVGSIVHGVFGTLPTGYAYGYGQALARASFPNFLTSSTRTFTATRTSGNATLTSVADTSKLGVGMPVEASGINTGCTIASLVLNTSITLNSGTCVTANGSTTITAFLTGYGSGGDSTTVGVSDCRGSAIVGLDIMPGSSAASRVTTAGSSINGAAINVNGGAQNVTIGTGNVPQLAVAITDPTHVHGSSNGSPFATVSGAANAASGGSIQVASSSTTTTATATGISATANTGSANTALNKMPPVLVADCIVRVSP